MSRECVMNADSHTHAHKLADGVRRPGLRIRCWRRRGGGSVYLYLYMCIYNIQTQRIHHRSLVSLDNKNRYDTIVLAKC